MVLHRWPGLPRAAGRERTLGTTAPHRAAGGSTNGAVWMGNAWAGGSQEKILRSETPPRASCHLSRQCIHGQLGRLPISGGTLLGGGEDFADRAPRGGGEMREAWAGVVGREHSVHPRPEPQPQFVGEPV